MTRDEFMYHAREEIGETLRPGANRIMNLVEQAWAEGKRHAEVELLTEVLKEALDKIGNDTTGTIDRE